MFLCRSDCRDRGSGRFCRGRVVCGIWQGCPRSCVRIVRGRDLGGGGVQELDLECEDLQYKGLNGMPF